jgi:hypothetical protein
MYLPPTAPEKIRQMIEQSRIAIRGRPIYYFSPASGTRYLTFATFAQLGTLEDRELRSHLEEIVTYSGRRNARQRPEVDFFMARGCGLVEKFAAMPLDNSREAHGRMCALLEQAVAAEYRKDDIDDPRWTGKLFKKLIDEQDDALVDDQSMGLDAEFSMRVEWQPGARIEEGELILDPALDEKFGANGEKRVSPVVRGLIFNLLQEYGDLEYINIGSVLASSQRDAARSGRREVYVAQIRRAGESEETTQIIRMQKWGVRERLDQGKSLETAMLESEEYSEYVLDRLLASRQLGMNMNNRLVARKVSEQYNGRTYCGTIWTPYFTRDYIPGSATDRIASPRKLGDDAYAKAFAYLLGKAAAPNIILGRAATTREAEVAGQVLFDMGDEILMEDANGRPGQIAAADHVGTFVDWKGTLESRVAEYAAPIRRRLGSVTCRQAFIDQYIEGFRERFARVQEDYAKRRRAFDTMFKHRPWDPKGSLACRWFYVLERLRKANAKQLDLPDPRRHRMTLAGTPASTRIGVHSH